jgi:hypothetical protein
MMYSVRRVRVPFLPVGAMVGITPLVARDLPDLTIWIQSLYIAWKTQPRSAHFVSRPRAELSPLLDSATKRPSDLGEGVESREV